VIEPGIEARPHFHEEQDELYFVHAGRARFALPGEARELGPGGSATSSRRRRARSRASARSRW
jgi:mannose-6-phosphate isomerase-like protein (cupin superfamily)